MFIFRWLSIVFIVTAVMLLGADLIGTLEKKALVIRSLQNVLLLFNYDATQAFVANFPPQLVRVSVAIVETPGWITFSLLAFVFERVDSIRAQVYTIPVASGLIAGESIMGIVVALLVAFGVMTR